MHSVFFEKIHAALPDYPYVDTEMQNINYLAHFHDEIEIAVIISGSTFITCDNSCFTAEAGDLCVFMPTEIHSFTSQEPNQLYIVKLHCKNSREKTNFAQLRLAGNRIRRSDVSPFRARIDALAREVTEKQPGYAYMANSLSQEILALLLRLGYLVKIDPNERKKQFFYTDLLERVAAFVEEHYAQPISLQDICMHCNFSKFYFAHAFKAATGSTFHHYLTAYRLDKALSMLSATDKKITEIALSCGFACTRSFGRAFRNFFGKTPGEYRKSLDKA